MFLPTHGDAWAPALSAGQAAYRDELARQLGTLPHPPEVDHLLDPADYLVERAYAVDDPRWIPPMAGSSCVSTAGASPPGAAPDAGGAAVAPKPSGGRLAASGWQPGIGIGAALVALALLVRRLRGDNRATA